MVVRGLSAEDEQDQQAQRKDQITSPGPGSLPPPRLGLVRGRPWRPATAHGAQSTLASHQAPCAAACRPAVRAASGQHHGGRTAPAMSVTLINIFEVPAGDEDEFIEAWEKDPRLPQDVSRAHRNRTAPVAA